MIRHGVAGEVWQDMARYVKARFGMVRQSIHGKEIRLMDFREQWNELDVVWSVPEDSPIPEGAEISEEDFDAIRESEDIYDDR